MAPRTNSVRYLTLALAFFPGGTAAAPRPEPAEAGRFVAVENFDADLLARELFRQTNEVRVAQGVAALKPEPRLTAAADGQAAMLALRIHSGHDNPIANQGDPSARVEQAGLSPGLVTENVATLGARNRERGRGYTYRELAAAFVRAWMDSPGHRANVLDPALHFLGCGARVAVLLGNPTAYAVQDFYTPAPRHEPVPPSVKPGATHLTR